MLVSGAFRRQKPAFTTLTARKLVENAKNTTEKIKKIDGFSSFLAFYLRASPGAASPLSSFEIRFIEHMGARLALPTAIVGTL